MPLGVLGLSRGRPFSPLSRAISARCSSITRSSAVMSPSKRMTSAFRSAGDRSSRFPGNDMPRQNLKSPYSESPDLPIFTRAVSLCPLQLSQAKSPLPGLLPLLPEKIKMASGGFRASAERPRKPFKRDDLPDDAHPETLEPTGNLTPLEYMLAVMNNPVYAALG